MCSSPGRLEPLSSHNPFCGARGHGSARGSWPIPHSCLQQGGRALPPPSRRHPQQQRPPALLRCSRRSARCPHNTAAPGPRPADPQSSGPRWPS
ncbi:hypothetical protein NDU88_001734 [Pleurodeles waltl]|uniref:Uncharacterized protein n=1 Tax=Pleurodeles waltl TaxID=8319 RepID=A0AAV7UTM1_PLEWA|nr:hypothetical protein NDU88_001734 [Pleurodeles waltl]